MRITIFEYERGLKYVKGRFQRVLLPGQYWAGLFSSTSIRKVDMRSQYISVPGQAILTRDGVGLKVSLTAVFEVIDPALAINQVSDYYQALYLVIQNGLRAVVSAIAIDDLIANHAELNAQLLTASAPNVSALGLRLTEVSIKDLMLPGELKKLYAQVVQARQEGKAQLERARGEAAALRSLANAARLADNHPNLLKLRMLQAVENSSGNSFMIGVPVSGEGDRL